MDSPLYIGVENEFIPFDTAGQQISSFTPHFSWFAEQQNPCIRVKSSPTAIRTKEGLGFYVDQNELELVTPPVRLNTGFATRLTDLLMMGRDRIVECTPGLQHTGYSMHWNLTRPDEMQSDLYPDNFYTGLVIPFHLFGLTPLSRGLNVREKTGRFEILGDTLESEDQIQATALMLGAYHLALLERKGSLPLHPLGRKQTGTQSWSFLDQGRATQVHVYDASYLEIQAISAQDYLERFYSWIKPFVGDLGTIFEVANLENFVYGKKALAIDQRKYFHFLKNKGGFKEGTYVPISTEDPRFPGPAIKNSGKKRPLPEEGKIWGSLPRVSQRIKKKSALQIYGWTEIRIGNRNFEGLCKIEEILRRVAKLPPSEKISFPVSENFCGTSNLIVQGPTTYSPALDTYESEEERRKREEEQRKREEEQKNFILNQMYSSLLKEKFFREFKRSRMFIPRPDLESQEPLEIPFLYQNSDPPKKLSEEEIYQIKENSDISYQQGLPFPRPFNDPHFRDYLEELQRIQNASSYLTEILGEPNVNSFLKALRRGQYER